MSRDAQQGAMESRDCWEEIYQLRDTGYDTCLAAETFESLFTRPRRSLSPIRLESLSPARRRALMSGTPTQRSPEELWLQQEIDAMQHEIDELATSIKQAGVEMGFEC